MGVLENKSYHNNVTFPISWKGGNTFPAMGYSKREVDILVKKNLVKFGQSMLDGKFSKKK